MKLNIRQFSLASVFLASGFIAGVLYQNQDAAQADIRKTPPREAFQSGGERSETQLKEISATLLRIEKKMADFERLMDNGTPNKKK